MQLDGEWFAFHLQPRLGRLRANHREYCVYMILTQRPRGDSQRTRTPNGTEVNLRVEIEK